MRLLPPEVHQIIGEGRLLKEGRVLGITKRVHIPLVYLFLWAMMWKRVNVKTSNDSRTEITKGAIKRDVSNFEGVSTDMTFRAGDTVAWHIYLDAPRANYQAVPHTYVYLRDRCMLLLLSCLEPESELRRNQT
jgi:hypothetical protein